MTPQLDAGPCIAQLRVRHPPRRNSRTSWSRGWPDAGAELVRRVVDDFQLGRIEALPQDPALASKAPRLKKTDGLVDWSRSAEAIQNQIRAMDPWPKAYTFWHRPDGPPARLILGPVAVVDPAGPRGAAGHGPGGRRRDGLMIAAGRGAVELRAVQPAGGRRHGDRGVSPRISPPAGRPIWPGRIALPAVGLRVVKWGVSRRRDWG